MSERHIFLTSNGLNDETKRKFFEVLQKKPCEAKVIFVPTAGIETDGARESFAIGLHELLLMGIRYENILVYNLELLLSKGYERTYSSHINDVPLVAKVLSEEELHEYDAILVGGGDSTVLCREMIRTGFGITLKNVIEQGLTYVGISAGSMYAAGNLKEGMHFMDNAIIPHWNGAKMESMPVDNKDVLLADGQVVYIDNTGARLV